MTGLTGASYQSATADPRGVPGFSGREGPVARW